MMYNDTNKIGNKNTNMSAVIGITFNKKSWYFMYTFNVVTRLIHRVGSCSGNIIINLNYKDFLYLHICASSQVSHLGFFAVQW
jgi:hypothetical protein